MSNDPSTTIEENKVGTGVGIRFVDPTSQAMSVEDLIEAFVEGTADFQVADDKAPFALLLRGLVEVTRLIRGALKASISGGDVRLPQHPEVLARVWKEALNFHDWAGARAAGLKRVAIAAKANAVTPEIINASDVRDAQKTLSRLTLDPPVDVATLLAVMASGREPKTANQILEQCPSLLAARALPSESWVRSDNPSPEPRTLEFLAVNALECMSNELLKLMKRFGEVAIGPLAIRLEDHFSQRPAPLEGPGADMKPPEDSSSRAKLLNSSKLGTASLALPRNDQRKKVVRDQTLICYSHQDEPFLAELRTHLKPYLRKDALKACSDKQIEPGAVRFDKIKAALAKTSVAVLLVSPDFLASDFIHEHEFGPLLRDAVACGVKILWVLMRDCSWKETPLKDYQSVLSPEKPFVGMSRVKRDTAWRKVCVAIKHLADSSGSAGTAPVGQEENVPVDLKPQEPFDLMNSDRPETAKTTNGTAPVQPFKVICPLHGIRTLAVWQRGLSDLARSVGWVCRLDRWSYGRFSLLAFLTPWTRKAKINWLRRQYDAEMHDRRLDIAKGQSPSVVAHSFGTYILGYTLLRFDFIRFNKVILCGSILPREFPWDKLIERGQVQALRNEFGIRDPWVKHVSCFVRGTGPSGALGFTCNHDRLEQKEFEYDHGDYFGIDHMEDRWIPFLNKPLAEIPRALDGLRIPRPHTSAPWYLYGVVLALLLMAMLFVAVSWVRGA